MKHNPVRFHLTIIAILGAVGTVACWWFLLGQHHTWKHWLASWLLVVNLITFGYYGFDKFLARRTWLDWWRVPEAVLHTLSAIGGSPGALLAMQIFRHKTIKTSFRILFWGIFVLQLALAAYVIKLLWQARG